MHFTKNKIDHGLAAIVFLGLLVSFVFPSLLISDVKTNASYYFLVLMPGLILVARNSNEFLALVKSNFGFQLILLLIFYWGISLLWVDLSVTGISKGGHSSQLRKFMAIIAYISVLFYVLSRYKQYINIFYISLFVFYIFGSLWGVQEILAVDPMKKSYRLGAKNSFGNPIQGAHYFGFFLSFSIGYIFTQKKDKVMILFVMAGIISFLFLFLTKSRGGYFAFAVVFVIASLWHMNYKKVVAVLVCIGSCGALYFLFPQFFLQRGASYRFEIWGDAWGYIQNKMWLGYGFNSELSILGGKFTHAHNLFLHLWTSTGLVGLIMFISVIGYVVKEAVKSGGQWLVSTLLAFLFFLFALLTDTRNLVGPPNEVWLCFWFVLVYLVSIKPKGVGIRGI